MIIVKDEQSPQCPTGIHHAVLQSIEELSTIATVSIFYLLLLLMHQMAKMLSNLKLPAHVR